MHKRRLSPAAAEFFATGIVWGLVLFVSLQLALHSPHTNHALSTSAAASPTAAAQAGAAGTTLHPPSSTSITDTHQATTSQHTTMKGVLSPTKQLNLNPESHTGASVVVVTTTTAPYIDWTLNWSHHLRLLGIKHAVVALDHATVTALTTHGMAAVLDASAEAQELGLMTHKSVRREYEHLRTLGYLRVGLPFHLMQQHKWQTLILSDADVIWLKHPSELLQLYPNAELMVSTDCLSVKAVTDRRPEVYRCGMQPAGWNSAWNSGLVVVRNTPAAVQAMTAWRDAMAPGSVSRSPEGWWVDDQLALTQLLDEGSLPFQGIDEKSADATSMDSVSSSSNSSSSGGGGSGGGGGSSGDSNSGGGSSSRSFRCPTILTMKRQLKTVALSPLDIAGGYVAFHQRLPEAYNVTPVALHYTFQAKFDNAGKLSRVRESNHWVMNPPERAGSRYLTYQNTVEAWLGEVEALWQKHTGRQMVDMHKHLLAAGYQLQVLAEALAAAQVLNRTLVPPRMVCYCTQDSVAWTDPLHTCSIAGSDKLPPFQCTIENLINVVELQRNYEHVMRTPDFLKRPEIKAAVEGSVLRVKWVQTQASSALQEEAVQQQQHQQQQQQLEIMPAPADVYTAQLLAAMQANAYADVQPVLPLQVTEKQLRQQLSTYKATAVIDLGSLAPGWFGGIEHRSLAAAVRQMVKDLTVYVGWCCLLEQEEGQNMDQAYVEYQKPAVPVIVPVLQDTNSSLGAPGNLLSASGSASSQQLLVDRGMRAAWQPAVELFQRPAWCNADYLRPLNFNISMRAQHPCSYLEGVEYTAEMQSGMSGVLQNLRKQLHTNRLS